MAGRRRADPRKAAKRAFAVGAAAAPDFPGMRRGRLADHAPAEIGGQGPILCRAARRCPAGSRLPNEPGGCGGPPLAVAFLAGGAAGSKQAGYFRRQSPPGARCGPPGMWGAQAAPGALCPHVPLRRYASGPLDAGPIRAHAAGISATSPKPRIQARVRRRIGNLKRFPPRRPGIRPDRRSAFGISE